MKKFLSPILAVLITLSVFSLAGCMGRESNENSDKSETIYYLNFKPEIAEVWEEIAKAYKDQKGVEVKIVTAASGTYEQTLKSEMAKTEAPTIFQINGPKGFTNWKTYCKDLKDSEIYKILSDKSLAVTSEGGVYGIPYVVEGYGIIYNSQIMDKYFSLSDKKVSINSTEEINSFDTFKAVVEDMTRLKGELGIEGVFGATSLQTGEDWRWHTHLANIPLYYEFTDKKIDLASDDTKKIDLKYAENFKNVFDLYINNSTTDKKLLGSKSVADSMAEFALGKCAMIQNGNWAWSQISKVSGNTVKEENIKFLPIYTGTSSDATQGLCIGTENFLCINKNVSETKQKLSEDFLYWLFSSSDGKKFVTEKLDFIAPFETFEENEVPGDPLAKEVIRWMKKDNVTTIPWNFTIFPSQSFKDSFGTALLSYAQGKHDFNTLKEKVISEWEKESK